MNTIAGNPLKSRVPRYFFYYKGTKREALGYNVFYANSYPENEYASIKVCRINNDFTIGVKLIH